MIDRFHRDLDSKINRRYVNFGDTIQPSEKSQGFLPIASKLKKEILITRS